MRTIFATCSFSARAISDDRALDAARRVFEHLELRRPRREQDHASGMRKLDETLHVLPAKRRLDRDRVRQCSA